MWTFLFFLKYYWICDNIASVLGFGFLASRHVRSQLPRTRNCTPCIERSLNHWTSEIPLPTLISVHFLFFFVCLLSRLCEGRESSDQDWNYSCGPMNNFSCGIQGTLWTVSWPYLQPLQGQSVWSGHQSQSHLFPSQDSGWESSTLTLTQGELAEFWRCLVGWDVKGCPLCKEVEMAHSGAGSPVEQLHSDFYPCWQSPYLQPHFLFSESV